MVNFLVSQSLKNRLFVIAAALMLALYGASVLPRVPVDIFPDLNKPLVTLMTEAEGLAPQEVESLVTFPIESSVAGLPGVVVLNHARGYRFEGHSRLHAVGAGDPDEQTRHS